VKGAGMSKAKKDAIDVKSILFGKACGALAADIC